MIEVKLTQGQISYISPLDSDLVDGGWYAHFFSEYANGGAYVAVRKNRDKEGKRFDEFLHRVILARMLNRELTSREHVDHRNRNPLDNQRDNLRLSTPSQNAANRTKNKLNTSGFKGVSWNKKAQKWKSVIRSNGVVKFLGYYDSPIDAAKAYDAVAKELHGEFAVLNFEES